MYNIINLKMNCFKDKNLFDIFPPITMQMCMLARIKYIYILQVGSGFKKSNKMEAFLLR